MPARELSTALQFIGRDASEYRLTKCDLLVTIIDQPNQGYEKLSSTRRG
jgi:hypothetical protein